MLGLAGMIGADGRVPGDGAHARTARPTTAPTSRPASTSRSASAGRCSRSSSSPRPRAPSPTSSSASAGTRSGRSSPARSPSRSPWRGRSRRAPVRRQVRGLARARLAPLPRLVDARRTPTLGALWSAPATARCRSDQGVDIMIAMTRQWLPLAPDYTRFPAAGAPPSGGPGSGTSSAASGCSTGSAPSSCSARACPTRPPSSRRRGRRSRQRARAARGHDRRGRRGVRERLLDGGLDPERRREGLPAAPRRARRRARHARRARPRDRRYETFLLLLGSFFVPLFGVLAADWLLGAEHPMHVRWSGIAAWAAGFALYQWIHPIGPEWWVDQAARIPGGRRHDRGVAPAFALAFALYAGVRSAHAPLGRRRARLAGSR